MMPEVDSACSTTAVRSLAARAETGLERRLADRRRHRLRAEHVYRGRCRSELDVIQRLGLADHFLAAARVVDAARARGIRVGPGRGATPGSIVAWALGITDVDPVQHGLVFERFLNADRVNAWAVSIDVCARRRAELLDLLPANGHDDIVLEPLPALTITQDVVERVTARNPDFDLDGIAPDDAAVFSMIANGDTTGVFWFDDPGFTGLAQRIEPSCFEDLLMVHTLYRPGPLARGLDTAVIDRKHGRRPRGAAHPALDTILANTYGVLVYQEQVIQIAHEVAGFRYTQGDLLRRALGKRRPAEIAEARTRFVTGAIANRFNEAEAIGIFEHLLDLAGFGFNRSHAVAYSWLVYQMAYLKHYFPAEFAAALEAHQNEERHP
jgi:DNA polymerase III alpha subunit